MIDRVEIAQNANRTKRRTQDQQRQILFLEPEPLMTADQDHRRNAGRHEIAEKAFLDRRQIAG